jgi:putative oxidoreductase
MFPDGWPGRGLLLLRLLAGTLLIQDAVAGLLRTPAPGGMALQIVALGAGLMLLIGLWTPVAGAIIVIVEVWIGFSKIGPVENSIVLASLGAALAMLGPGVLSVDARLFGRKLIDIRDR